jgi:hypothetical protein
MRPLLALFLMPLLALPAWAADDPKVDYPAGFRGWKHIKSGIILKDHGDFGLIGGFRHVYANPKAVRGYKSGKFPDGSFVVMDILEAKEGDKSLDEGSRKHVIVMQRDSKRFAATGGWGYEVFKGTSRTERAVPDIPRNACFACHAAQKDRDFIFSTLRD